MPEYKLTWQKEYGDLPIVRGPAVLRENEVCPWAISGKFLEGKKVSLSYLGGRAGTPIKVAKGVRSRVGGHRGKMKYTIKRIKHSGQLFVKNKKVIFSSEGRSFQIPFGALINFEPYENGTEFQKEKTGFKLETFNEDATELFAIVSDRATRGT